jgi:VanZ family protein
MKSLLFKNWHWMRYFRLALALMLFAQAYETQQWFYLLFGLFFLMQALLNLGCGAAGCNVNYKNKKQE